MDNRDMFDLSGRVALVTGAGVGIGRAIALALAERGAAVGVHYHLSEVQARETLSMIRDAGSDGMLLKADLSLEAGANSIVDGLAAKYSRLDILVNNAGSPIRRTKIEDCPLDLWRAVFDVNMTSAFMVTKRAIPLLRKSGKGSIINILSLSIQTGGANGAGPYAASKGALEIFTRTLAKELGPEIRANAICPGVIETRHHEVFSTPESMERYKNETPLQRNGTAGEVAAAAVFLAGDAGSFTNGALIDINGGRFLR